MIAPRTFWWMTGLALLSCLLPLTQTSGSPASDWVNHPVASVVVQGLTDTPEQLVLNQIRLAKGNPYDPKVVQQDIIRITHLGRFKTVRVQITPQKDGTVIVVYIVQEQAIISDVQVVGNKAISDQELIGSVVLQGGDPVDPYLIDRGKQAIKRLYEQKGFFVTDVKIDEPLLRDSQVLLYRVREGPRVKIQAIRFQGNKSFSGKKLQSRIQSKTHVIIFREGDLSRSLLDEDADRLRAYYRDRGYLDAQVGREIQLSNNQRNAIVIFQIQEGERYTTRSIKVQGNKLYSKAQIIEAMTLRVGDVYAANLVNKSRKALLDYYGKLGFIATQIDIERLFDDKLPQVDVVIHIQEGSPYMVGKISIRGNRITQDHVILREVRGMEPGRRFDREGIDLTKKRLDGSAWFDQTRITLLGSDQDPARDVLIEVHEKNTGSLSFGAGISSDSGILGAIELTQRNFDITDTPESFGEFYSGKAFKGAGQFFNITLQPGDQYSRFAISFRDPYIFDSHFSFNSSLFYFQRDRYDYIEKRIGISLGVGQHFGDVWVGNVSTRFENIDIADVGTRAEADISAVSGKSTLSSLTLSMTRSTWDSRMFPSRGSRTRISLSRAGALGGDYDFTRFSIEWQKYWTVDEDFLGRKTTVRLKTEVGTILEKGQAPIFERFFAGGHRSIRGFDFRGVGPFGKTVGGAKTQESIGGDWMFLLGFEYNKPVYKDNIRMVMFVDSGTVLATAGLDSYRVSAGMGLRLKIPFLGQAPFAFDFAIPLMKQSDDLTRIFSFDIALPF